MGGFGTSPLELMACDAMLKGIVYLDEFIYSASWIAGTATALGSLATIQVQIQINGDSDFVAQEMNLTAIDTAQGGGVGDCVDCPDLLLTVTRAGSGREIMNQAQHVINICGNYFTAHYPAHKPMPGLYAANNIISVTLQNRTTTAFNRVDLALPGFKVFYITNAQGQTGDRRSVFHAL